MIIHLSTVFYPSVCGAKQTMKGMICIELLIQEQRRTVLTRSLTHDELLIMWI